MADYKQLRCIHLPKSPHPGVTAGPDGFQFVEMPYAELLRFYNDAVADAETTASKLGFTAKSTRELKAIVSNWQTRDGFYGGTIEQMQQYLANGYRVGQLTGSFLPGVLRTRDGDSLRGRWLWDEHGDEIDVTMALSGDPTCFRSFQLAPTLGGMNVVALMAFTSGTDFDIIAQYGAWIAKLLATCQTAGLSPSLVIDQYGSYVASDTDKTLIRVRVKQENDALDWRRYSALFSPCGFRHLCFAALFRGCGPSDLVPGSVCSTLGYPISPPTDEHQWDLSWDEPTRTLTVWGDRSPSRFDSAHLTQRLIETGALNPEYQEV